jgi:hypothetical protein
MLLVVLMVAAAVCVVWLRAVSESVWGGLLSACGTPWMCLCMCSQCQHLRQQQLELLLLPLLLQTFSTRMQPTAPPPAGAAAQILLRQAWCRRCQECC